MIILIPAFVRHLADGTGSSAADLSRRRAEASCAQQAALRSARVAAASVGWHVD